MKKPKYFKNILIVRTDRIGDVVLTTPAIKALRKAYPSTRISVLVAPATYDLVKGNPYIDDILLDDRMGKNKGPLGFLKLVNDLRAKKFDLAIIFHTKRRYNLACFIAAIGCRMGYKNDKFGFLLSHPLRDVRAGGERHEAEYCMDVLKTIGVRGGELDTYVPLQKEAEAWVNQWLADNNLQPKEFIAVHPGASDPAKCWPAANFAALIDQLAEKAGVKIILIGSLDTTALGQDTCRQARRSSFVINLTGKTTLAQTASLLRRTSLLISNDSGPVHVAAGVGCYVISLFMRNMPGINSERWKPLGEKSFIIDNKVKPGAISVEDVLGLSQQILQKNTQYEIY